MNTPIKKLRLGPLPKTESTKITFTCSVRLKAELDRYATQHVQAHGEMVDATMLIPHMLDAFMAGDRGFKSRSASSAAQVPRHNAPPTGHKG